MVQSDTNVSSISKFVSTLLNRHGIGGPDCAPAGPKISVVMPSLNQGRFIRRAILSVLNQEYANIELIVIDGGSTDETVDILKEFGTHIDHWRSEKDRGQAHALNKGFALATGEIFGWQNADDLYLPGAFAAAVEAFRSAPNAGIVYGDWLAIDEQDTTLELTYALPPRRPRFSYENMKAYNQSMFWRREVHARFGEFDENLNLLIDNDLIIRFLGKEGVQGFQRIPRFLGAFRLHEAQKTDMTALAKARLEEEVLLDRKHGFPPGNSIRGRYYRILFRMFQLRHSLRRGGASYALRKTGSGLKQRKGLL